MERIFSLFHNYKVLKMCSNKNTFGQLCCSWAFYRFIYIWYTDIFTFSPRSHTPGEGQSVSSSEPHILHHKHTISRFLSLTHVSSQKSFKFRTNITEETDTLVTPSAALHIISDRPVWRHDECVFTCVSSTSGICRGSRSHWSSPILEDLYTAWWTPEDLTRAPRPAADAATTISTYSWHVTRKTWNNYLFKLISHVKRLTNHNWAHLHIKAHVSILLSLKD